MKKRLLSITFVAAMVLIFGGCASKKEFAPSTNTNQQKAVLYLYMPSDLSIEDNQYSVYVNTYLMGKVGSNNYLPIEVPTGKVAVTIKHSDVVRAHREHDELTFDAVESGQTLYVKAFLKNGPKLQRIDSATGSQEIEKTIFFEQGLDVSKLGRQVRGEQLPLDMPRLLEPGAANIEPANQVRQAQPVPVPQATSEERLEKLYELKEKGALTEEEYNTLKAKIIAE